MRVLKGDAVVKLIDINRLNISTGNVNVQSGCDKLVDAAIKCHKV